MPFVNERSLYQLQWGFRKQGRSLDDFLGWAKQELRPVMKRVLSILGAPDAPLADDARVVAKHFWRDEPPAQTGSLRVSRVKRFGETALTFYRVESP